MPQPNDAELTELYTASTGCDVEDDEPNTPAPGDAPTGDFELHLQAVAGNALGSGGADYVLTITAIDDTEAARNAALDPTGTPFSEEFSGSFNWVACGTNFVKDETYLIPVPTSGVRGHVFHYVATLVAVDSGVVSFIESNQFILV